MGSFAKAGRRRASHHDRGSASFSRELASTLRPTGKANLSAHFRTIGTSSTPLWPNAEMNLTRLWTLGIGHWNLKDIGYWWKGSKRPRSHEWRGHFPLFLKQPKSEKMKSVQKLILKRWRSSGQASQTRVLPLLYVQNGENYSHLLRTQWTINKL